MKLEILSPDAILFSGEADSVTLPGAKGSFQILKNHAPIISSLAKGAVSFSSNGEIRKIEVENGLIEMHDNKIVICVDNLY